MNSRRPVWEKQTPVQGAPRIMLSFDQRLAGDENVRANRAIRAPQNTKLLRKLQSGTCATLPEL